MSLRLRLAALLASAAGTLEGWAYRLAGPPAAPPPAPAEHVPVIVARYVSPRRLDLRELYDVLACEAIDRWQESGAPLSAELRTVEVLDRARAWTPVDAVLSTRSGRC